MSISVASIGFVLPQNRQLMLKGDCIPYNPYYKISKMKSKINEKLKIFNKDFTKKKIRIYEKGCEKI